MILPVTRTLVLALAAASVAVGFQEAWDGITADGIRAHLFFLSRDELRGRAPGTRGGQLAADYIESQLLRMGLRPVDGSYSQEVPLVGVTADPASVSLTFEVDDGRVDAQYPSDAVIWAGPDRPSVRVDGELVFVGYGIHAPEWEWDDYQGRDVSGRVVVILVGDPPAPPDEPGLFDGPAMTYYGRWSYKLEEARRQGAAGALLVHTDEAAGYDWGVVESSWTGEQLILPEADDDAALRLRGWITRDLARRALAQAGLDLAELYVRAGRRDFRPAATGLTVRARLESRSRRLSSRNVVGYRPGTGPDSQVVVFTAHYDHLGVGPPVEGDSIYNGAYDNASGVGLLLEVAEAFAELDEPTPRGALFIATTAEEAGLLGARHYVRNPLVPLERTVTAINVDGASLWGETDDVVALGADRSTLSRLLHPRADQLGLQIVPDPEAGAGTFFRSDHFPFAEAGVPVLYVRHGRDFRDRPDGWGARLMEQWSARNYHQPSDEYSASLDLAGAVQQARLVFGVGYDLVAGDFVPEWDPDSPFRNARGQ